MLMRCIEIEALNLSDLCVSLGELRVRSHFNAENAEKDAEYADYGNEILLE